MALSRTIQIYTKFTNLYNWCGFSLFTFLFYFNICSKDIPVVNYLLSSAGALGVGFGLPFFVPILSIKWKVITID